jgi:hypothetical protein
MTNTDMGTACAISTGRSGEGPFRAVKLRQQASGFELVWKKSWDSVDTTGTERSDLASEQVVVVAESKGVVFYRIDIPPVRDNQVGPVVKMQAEALLPLGSDEMELCWRADKVAGASRGVTIAAGRKDKLAGFILTAKRFAASKVLLDYDGVVKAWRELLGGTDARTVLLSVTENGTGVLLAENGRLSQAVSLDIGSGDLLGDQGRGGAGELFVHDLRNALELFGADGEVVLLSQDAETQKKVISCLAEAGINAREAVYESSLVKGTEEINPEDIIEYIAPIGAAMLALEADGGELGLFEGLHRATEDGDTKQSGGSLKRPCIITVVMAILFLLVCYGIDKASLAQLRKHMYANSGKDDGTNGGALIEHQKMRKLIAGSRPDMLELLSKISDSSSDGILLDAITFRKRQPVMINGKCKSYEQLYELQKKLGAQGGIKEVRIVNSAVEKNGGKVGFRMSFHYKNFTRK